MVLMRQKSWMRRPPSCRSAKVTLPSRRLERRRRQGLARAAAAGSEVQGVRQPMGLPARGVEPTKKLDAPPAALQAGKGGLARAADRAQGPGDAHGAALDSRKAVEDLTSGGR